MLASLFGDWRSFIPWTPPILLLLFGFDDYRFCRVMEQAPPRDLMRLRERLDQRLTKVYLDTLTLKQNALALKDFKEIVIQRTARSETLTAEHLCMCA
jgi:hypothetical protein